MDLRQLQILRTVIAASVSAENEPAYKKLEASLMQRAGIEVKKNPKESVRLLARRLKRGR